MNNNIISKYKRTSATCLIFVFVFLLSTVNCYSEEKDYIFSYGSLISSESRARTGISNNPIPVRVSGLQRGWVSRVPQAKTTALGIYRSLEASCNGIIFEVAKEEVSKFDEREGSSYERVRIGLSDIEIIDTAVGGKGQFVLPVSSRIWVYMPKESLFPTDELPIIQSYVDVVLSGCLEYGLDYAKEFTQSTKGWDYSWINDRQCPIYVRAMKFVPEMATIDDILYKITGRLPSDKSVDASCKCF